MKIFASDYDGTLRTEETVSEENKQAIARWRKAGNLFVLVSGRSLESMQKEIEVNQFEVDYIIGNNGGAIYDADFHEIKSYYFPFRQALDIISYIKQERTISYVLNDGFHRSKTILDPSREDQKYAHTSMTFCEAEILANQKIAQIVVSLDCDADTRRIADHINSTFGQFACAYRNINCVDVAPYGVSKSTGLFYIVAKTKVNKEDVYTIGDSFNDIPMLETFHGFAMDQAPAQVKSYAKHIVAQPSVAIQDILALDKA